jgi:hypothetical protein
VRFEVEKQIGGEKWPELVCRLHNKRGWFAGAFAKSQKATVSFVVVSHFVVMEQLFSHWTDFHEIKYSSIFRVSVEDI